MSSDFNINGFEEIQKELDSMCTNISKYSKHSSIRGIEKLTPAFMKKHTTFASFDEFLKAGNLNLDTTSNDELNKYVAANTPFMDFQDMLIEAIADTLFD